MKGLDTETGASAIYPLLATACFDGWRMVGTEIDAESVAYARKNVVGHTKNDVTLTSRVELRHVEEQDPFIPDDDDVGFSFTMCNPPFYSSWEEMERGAVLKRERPNAVSSSFLVSIISLSVDRPSCADQSCIASHVDDTG